MKITNTCRSGAFLRAFTVISILAAALLGSGCIAIPMGKETFTTEYPTDIRATSDAPAIVCQDCEVLAQASDETHLSASFMLSGTLAIEQPQEQHYATVTVEKQKKMAFGLFPGNAESFLRPSDALQPMLGWEYEGNGNYSTAVAVPRGTDPSSVRAPSEPVLMVNPFAGFLFVPYSLLYVPFFGGYGCDSHHWRDGDGSFDKTNLIGFFSEEEREQIEAWTWKDADKHKQARNWSLQSHSSWIGFHKYCSYVVRGGGWSEKTTPVSAKKSVEKHILVGPYSATLEFPSLGFSQTVEVEEGRTLADFSLADAANGEPFASGTIRFDPPAGGFAAIHDAKSRSILEMSRGQKLPVTVELPVPRLANIADVGTTEEANDAAFRNHDDATPPYQFTSIEPKNGKLVVRVSVRDPSKTLAIDPQVRPEVRRLFREQFATGENAARREKVTMSLVDGGKTLVYTVEFE